jgi:hypothetical protein
VPAAPPIFGSTGSTTIVLASVLVVVGIVMICVAVWLVRTTRSDTRALGPLEVMGDRSFRRRDDGGRTRMLTSARPDGAHPPAPMLEVDAAEPLEVAATAPEVATAAAVSDAEPVPDVPDVDDVGDVADVSPAAAQLDPPAEPEPEPEPDVAADETDVEPAEDASTAAVEEPQPAERT